MFNTIAKVLAILMLLGVLLERLSYATARDTEPFHAAVAQAIEGVPTTFGAWRSESVPVPEPAQKLLRPSATLARVYTEAGTGLSATLVIVHCPDTRDLAGHYPLRCYPSSGWLTVGEPSEISVGAAGTSVPLRRYEFVRHSFVREQRKVVYGTFLIPGRGVVPSMDAVYTVASDYRARLYGATQVQVVLPDGFPRDEELRVVGEMLERVAPVIKVIQSRARRSS